MSEYFRCHVVMLTNLLRGVVRQSSFVIETSRQYSLTVSLCYWKVETTKRTKIGTEICPSKLVYEASQEIVENSSRIFKVLKWGTLFQNIICLTRTAGIDVENLLKIDWNCSKRESFVGGCLFTDIISSFEKSLTCCMHLFICTWLLSIFHDKDS